MLWTPAHPEAAFFLLPSRAWEMFAGGLVFLCGQRVILSERRRTVLEAVGLGLIVVSILVFTTATSWPGWRATLPIVGTVAVLVAHRRRSRWTQSRLAQWGGTCSYSIYLWHWPVVVLLAYFNLQRSRPAVLVAVLVTAALGWLSYRWIESTARVALQRRRPAHRALWLTAALLAAVAFALVALGHGGSRRVLDRGNFRESDLLMPLSSNGFCFRNVAGAERTPVDDRSTPCVLGQRGAARAGLLIGDSFAGQYEPFWDRVARHADVRIDALTTNWCFPSTDQAFSYDKMSPAFRQCTIDRAFLQQHLDAYDFVVFAGYWRIMYDEHLQAGFFDAIEQAARRGKLVVVMAAPTEFEVDVARQFRRRVAVGLGFDARDYIGQTDADARADNESIARYCARFANVLFLSRETLFAQDVTRDAVPYSLDGKHISIYGSRMAADAFVQSHAYQELTRRLRGETRAGQAPDANGVQTPR